MAAEHILAIALAAQAAASSSVERAIAYLAGEVPRWSKENHCFSCHNNGDGARALYTAVRLGYRVPAEALSDTTRWLLDPAKWDRNGGNPGFSDKKLARIQFAASLAEARDAGLAHDRGALIQAAESLVPYQEADGSWRVDAHATAGSPATYGTALATYMARRTLERAGRARFAAAIAKANRWFLQTTPGSVLDAAATLLARPDAEPVRKQCLDLIVRAQTSGGGWGPQLHAPAEPFDTAVVLLALRGLKAQGRIPPLIARGRAYLIATQQPSGGWPETTRPPGAQSYAQHISTSGWATLALLLTDPKR